MFRKSYRRLLRWNDEFRSPSSRSARTSGHARRRMPSSALADGQNALGLAACPIVECRRALRRIGRLLGSAKDSPTSPHELEDRSAATPRTHAACPSCSATARLQRTSPREGPAMIGRRTRPARVAVLALVFAIGLLAPPRPSEVRAATPDLTIVSDATYHVRPAIARAGHGRHDRSRTIFAIRRAPLASRHRVPRRPAGNLALRSRQCVAVGSAPRGGTTTTRCCGSTSGGACSAARPRKYRLRST
jgi:hypothetical protein